MDTLVLGVDFRPVAFASWQNVIGWILNRVAEVIDEHPDKYIRTVSWSVKTPSVVRLLNPIHKKRAIKFSRTNIYLRDLGKCQYCGLHVSLSKYTFDHVLPKAQGGITKWENVCVACVACNQRKGGRTPEQAKMKLLSIPMRPKKLPDILTPGLVYRPGMPASWSDWLKNQVYWNGTLEE